MESGTNNSLCHHQNFFDKIIKCLATNCIVHLFDNKLIRKECPFLDQTDLKKNYHTTTSRIGVELTTIVVGTTDNL